MAWLRHKYHQHCRPVSGNIMVMCYHINYLYNKSLLFTLIVTTAIILVCTTLPYGIVCVVSAFSKLMLLRLGLVYHGNHHVYIYIYS